MINKNHYLNEWIKQRDGKREEEHQKIVNNLIAENNILRTELNKALHALARTPVPPGLIFANYQSMASTTAVYPNIGSNIYYPALGLAGEAGEVCDKISKIMRDHNDIVSNEMKLELEKELGDVLWFLSQLATELGLFLEDIANNNIKKLQSRKERGKLHGSGDNR